MASSASPTRFGLGAAIAPFAWLPAVLSPGSILGLGAPGTRTGFCSPQPRVASATKPAATGRTEKPAELVFRGVPPA